jgi:circadian clock protein KaiC
VAANEYAISKLHTGVKGLDELLYGGVPEGSQILLAGDSGSGKTLLSFEIAYNLAKSGKNTVYITIDQSINSLMKNVANAFTGMRDIDELRSSKKLSIIEKEIDTAFKSRENLLMFIADAIKMTEANSSKVLFLDSLSLFRSLMENDRAFTSSMNYISESFSNVGLTTFMIMEDSMNELDRVPGLLEESMFDGIIRLTKKTGQTSPMRHFATIVKMRYSRYLPNSVPFEITSSGIVIRSPQGML